MDRMINNLCDQTDSLLETTMSGQVPAFYVLDIRNPSDHVAHGPFESREIAIAERQRIAGDGLEEGQNLVFKGLLISDEVNEADYRLGNQNATAGGKEPEQTGEDMTNKTQLGKGKEAPKQTAIPAQDGTELAKAKATKSQKKGEKEDGEGEPKQEEKAPGNTSTGTAPKQAGKPMPEAPGTKSQKKGDEPGAVKNEGKEERGKRDGTGPYKDSAQRNEKGNLGKRKERGEKCPNESKDVVEGKDERGKRDGTGPYKGSALAGKEGMRKQAGEKCPQEQQGEDPTKKAEGTKTVKAAEKDTGEGLEQVESKINEQDPDPEEPIANDPVGDEDTSTSPGPSGIEPPKEAPVSDETQPDQEYLGNKGDMFYYVKYVKDDADQPTDMELVDAEGNVVMKASDSGLEAGDVLGFVRAAIQEAELEAISYNVVAQYIIPRLEELEAMQGEKPAEEENGDGDGQIEEPKDEETPTERKKAKKDDAEDKASEGKVPQIPFKSEDKLIDELLEKHGLKEN